MHLTKNSEVRPLKIKQLKHKRVEIELRQLAATLPAGAKLPAERDLAIEYQCNFLTVRKALKELVSDGLITRRIGSGTFISHKNHQHQPHNGVSAHTKRVGLLVYEKGNDYAFSVLQAIAHVSLQESVEVRSCWVRDFADDGLRQSEMLMKEGCVAISLPWFPHTMTEEIRSFVHRCPLPVSIPILIPGLERNCFEKGLFGDTLLTGTEGLGRYFMELGHQRLAFLGPDAPGDMILQQKLGAYSCFTSRENLPSLCGLVPAGTQAMDRLAQRWKDYRREIAIISYDDEHALRFMTSMHKIGLSAPADFAIVGYNNIDASHYSDPPLSTVAQNFEYVGHWLLRSALALSRNELAQSVETPALKFLVRETCDGFEKINPSLIGQLKKLKLDIVQGDIGLQEPVEQAAEIVG